jgi:hypothetical protein
LVLAALIFWFGGTVGIFIHKVRKRA